MPPADEDPEAAEDLLPAADCNWLKARGFEYEARLDGGLIDLVIREYPLPAGYDRTKSDLLIRLPASWPDGMPDMFWFEPCLRLTSGVWPDRADHFQPIAGRTWQRWSRHLGAAAWRSGIDGLANYLAIVDRALAEAVR